MQQIEQQLEHLFEAEKWITVRNLDESRICECLTYLLDLCLVLLKFDLGISQLKSIEFKAHALMSNWRSLVT